MIFLPLEYLESGQSVDITVALHMGAQRKTKILLKWDDVNGSKENEVILTL